MKLKSTVIDDVDALFTKLRISRFRARLEELGDDPDWVNMTAAEVIVVKSL
ncbi:hypothetical protein [Flaviflexus equikiangi]|uniref:hypothetical protein n=1 Tax=Flaviflexus equikiangi TaxID=2758573 RepID=UPI0015F3DF40|nr:hypothetical protein [Flaviflexus equikiangi]